MLMVASVIPTTSPIRPRRSLIPATVAATSFISVIVCRYTPVCEGRRAPPASASHPRGEARADARGAARRGRAAVRRARLRGLVRRGDRRGGGLHARCVLRELRDQGGAVRRPAPAPRVRHVPQHRRSRAPSPRRGSPCAISARGSPRCRAIPTARGCSGCGSRCSPTPTATSACATSCPGSGAGPARSGRRASRRPTRTPAETPPLAPDVLASAMIAMDIGLALQHYVDPDAVPAERLSRRLRRDLRAAAAGVESPPCGGRRTARHCPRSSCALVAVMVLAVPATADARRTVPRGWAGVDIDGSLFDPRVNLDSEFDEMAADGVEAVRVAVYWSEAQPYATWADVPGDGQGALRRRRRGPDRLRGPRRRRRARGRAQRRGPARGPVGAAVGAHGPRPDRRRRPRTSRTRPSSRKLARRYGTDGTFWDAATRAPPPPRDRLAGVERADGAGVLDRAAVHGPLRRPPQGGAAAAEGGRPARPA